MTNDILKTKKDFVLLVSVADANPNGDPLASNLPRTRMDGRGEISAECIKRKIRNRLQDMGERIFVQSDDRCDDGCLSLDDRVKACGAMMDAEKARDKQLYKETACKTWWDVRSFGQVFAFKDDSEEEVDGKKTKISRITTGIRGPISIFPAKSIDPINIISDQITKSVNSITDKKDPMKRSSDTMGMKHRVEFGLYVIKGSVNVQLAEKNGFTEDDAEKLKQALATLFVNDVSAARPDGSMHIHKMFWFDHSCAIGDYSTANVHESIKVTLKDGVDEPTSVDDYTVTVDYKKIEKFIDKEIEIKETI